ncbi:MAG: hypothetical protein CL607_17710 [Anaerolineaceae bacterium]|nr:hypothetical protein [Anaerolineaceae bacterium]
MYTDMINHITDSNACFLLGAGASRCADKPLMGELTQLVKKDLDSKPGELLSDLIGENERDATIEDLLNHLLQLQKLLKARRTIKVFDFELQDVEKWIRDIQESIAKHIGGDWTHSDIHMRFFRRLAKHSTKITRDVFTLNYDNVIEATLEVCRLPYTDGFRGANNAYFDMDLYTSSSTYGTFFNLYKLHGSINWYRDSEGHVRRKNVVNEGEPVMVYPAEQKYIQTQYGVYETLLTLFRDRLRATKHNNKLIVCGYSFGDEHINNAIVDGILSRDSNLTVWAFVGADDNNIDKQILDFENRIAACDDRLNVVIGNKECIGKGFESSSAAELAELKALDLWKFENLVDMIANTDE